MIISYEKTVFPVFPFFLFFYDCGWQAVPTSAHLHIVKRFWLRLEISFHPHSAGKQAIFTLLWKSLKQSRKTVCRNSELFIWLRVRLRNYVWDVALLHLVYGTGWDGGPSKALGDTPANWILCSNTIHFLFENFNQCPVFVGGVKLLLLYNIQGS